jgi:hypothetical protein
MSPLFASWFQMQHGGEKGLPENLTPWTTGEEVHTNFSPEETLGGGDEYALFTYRPLWIPGWWCLGRCSRSVGECPVGILYTAWTDKEGAEQRWRRKGARSPQRVPSAYWRNTRKGRRFRCQRCIPAGTTLESACTLYARSNQLRESKTIVL